MNPISRVLYFLQQALRLLRTSPWLAAISVLTLAVSLSVVGVLAMGMLGAERLIDQPIHHTVYCTCAGAELCRHNSRVRSFASPDAETRCALPTSARSTHLQRVLSL